MNKLPLPLVCAAILLPGVAVRIAALQTIGLPDEIVWAEAEKIARSLAETGAFANPYPIETGPTAHHAPIYPWLLSLIYHAFGSGPSAVAAQLAMNLSRAALTCALLPVLADAVRWPRSVAVAAGLAGAIAPIRILKEMRWEHRLAHQPTPCTRASYRRRSRRAGTGFAAIVSSQTLGPDRYKAEVRDFVARIERWDTDREEPPGMYFHQRGHLSRFLLEMIPPGPLRASVLQAFVGLLRASPSPGKTRRSGSSMSAELMKRRGASPIDVDPAKRAMERTGDPVKAMYIHLERAATPSIAR